MDRENFPWQERRVKTDSESIEDSSFWPGVADSLLAALLVVVLLTFGGLVLFALNPESTDRTLERLRAENAGLREANERFKAERVRLLAEIDRLKREPPIIELPDAQNGNFELGKALISPEFATLLEHRVFPRLLKIVEEYPTVDTIEIIGHTDNKPISSSRSNLDTRLAVVLQSDYGTSSLFAGSNADLGLMRAAAVRESWIQWVQQQPATFSRKIGVRCYSAANAIPPSGTASVPSEDRDKRARRIEIRFTKLKGVNTSE
jgi:flagellar motor protein MotB